MLRAAAPLVRAAAGGTGGPALRAATSALRRFDVLPAAGSRAGLTPAAVRIERARSVRNGERAEQTAVTVWFGEGPSLPVPGGGGVRSAMRIGTGVLGAAALAAMTAIVARKEEARSKVIDATARPSNPAS